MIFAGDVSGLSGTDPFVVVGAVVGALTLVGTFVLIALTIVMIRTTRPSFRLLHIMVDPWNPFTGDPLPAGLPRDVSLVFVNDGPGIAPDTRILASGLPGMEDAEIRFPADGSPTLPVGGTVTLGPWTFTPTDSTEPWPDRNFSRGDDVRFDFSGIRVRFEWTQRGRKRPSPFRDLDLAQRSVPVLFAEKTRNPIAFKLEMEARRDERSRPMLSDGVPERRD